MSRRRHKHEDHVNHEAWAIPYGDLVTLLLAFFVVMYAISSVNEGKYRVLSDSLFAAFRGSPRTLQPEQFGEKAVGSGADIHMTIVQQAIIKKRLGPLRPALAEGEKPPSLMDSFRQASQTTSAAPAKKPKTQARGEEPKGKPAGPPPRSPRKKKKRSGRRR